MKWHMAIKPNLNIYDLRAKSAIYYDLRPRNAKQKRDFFGSIFRES